MSDSSRRLHVSARIEDKIRAALARLLRRRGWSPRVTASTGYGGPGTVRIFARVLLSPPDQQRRRRWTKNWLRPEARPAETPRPPRGWRSLLTLPVAGATVVVVVAVDGTRHQVRSERGGYVHATLSADMTSGWHEAALQVEARTPVSCRVRVADPESSLGVISDIDDTILVTWLPRPLIALWNSFVVRENLRRPVAGMAEMLRAVAGEDAFVAYVSTGAWNFAPHLERFIAEHHFPPGPLLLTDWGPTHSGWFRSGATHKRESLERLRSEHPRTRWLLVGDDGQRDPQVYREFAIQNPGSVLAVAIRHLSPVQQLLAAGSPAAVTESAAAPGAAAPPVAWVVGADGFALLEGLSALGLVPPTVRGG